MRWRGLQQAGMVALGCGLLAFAATALLPRDARADCSLSGATVTCAPPGTGGYQAGTTDSLTVNIQSGATVVNSGSQSILVQDFSTITNNGTINAAGSANAIRARTDNIVTNNGGISVVDGSAIKLDDNTSLPAFVNITNNGTITVTGSGAGIYVGSKHRIVNYGTIAGGNGYGITADSNNVITNYGTISSVGSFGVAVQLVNPGNTLYNYGTISSSGGLALDICSCTLGTVIENKSTGIINGYVNVDGAGNTFTNAGLLQVTGSTLQGYPTFLVTNQTLGGLGNTFVQTSTGTLALRMDNGGVIDNLYADAITPGGTVKIVMQPQLYQARTTSGTAILLSTYGSGTLGNTISAPFDRYTASSPFFTVTPIYDTGNSSNYTSIQFQLDRIGFGSVGGLTQNQQAVGNALEGAYSPSLDPNSAAGQFYANLFTASSTGVYDQLSGSGTAAAQTSSFSAAVQFNDTMFQQGLAWLTGTTGPGAVSSAPLQYASSGRFEGKPGHDAFAAMPRAAPKPPEWRAWALGFSSTRSISGGGNAADQSIQTAGGAFGVERTFGPDLLFGIGAGGSNSHFSASSLSTSGRIDGGHIGAYVARRWGDIYALATINYARFDNATDRTIAGVGPTENAHGRFASDQIGGRLELGWRRTISGYTVTPFVAVEPAALWQQDYTESSTTVTGGNGILGLSYAARETTSLPTFLGVQLDANYALGDGQRLQPFLRAAWVHEFMPNRQIQASFVSVPSASFTIDGARPARDAARLSGGTTWTIGPATALFARIDSEMSGSGIMLAGAVGGIFTW